VNECYDFNHVQLCIAENSYGIDDRTGISWSCANNYCACAFSFLDQFLDQELIYHYTSCSSSKKA